MSEPDLTTDFPQTQTNLQTPRLRSWGFACSCGPASSCPANALNTRCPVGMPWVCGRQLALPFADPIDRRDVVGDDAAPRGVSPDCNTGVHRESSLKLID